MENIKEEKRKHTIHFWAIGIMSVVILIFLIELWDIVIKPAIPHTKTHYSDYAEFRMEAFDFFPEELPDSSENI